MPTGSRGKEPLIIAKKVHIEICNIHHIHVFLLLAMEETAMGAHLLLQSRRECLGLALVSMWGGALRGSLISGFQDFFASIGKAFILARGLGAGLSFYLV